MRGGNTVVHIWRFSPADFDSDPWVALAQQRALATRDYSIIHFYEVFLYRSFQEGGFLPTDPDLLGAALSMAPEDAARGLEFWSQKRCAKVKIDGDLCFNARVLRSVDGEIAYRIEQKERGAEGGKAKARNKIASGGLASAKKPPSDRLAPPSEKASPPAPTPSPSPAPAPAPSPGQNGSSTIGGGGARERPRTTTRAAQSDFAARHGITFDPDDPDQAELVDLCETLATLTNTGDPDADDTATAELEAVSTTKDGKASITDGNLVGVPARWITGSLRAARQRRQELESEAT